jgi:hypothetical protein
MLTGKILTSEDRSLWSHPLVNGVKVTLEWRDLEPAARQYKLDKVKAIFDAVPANKQKVLEVLGGVFAPSYISPRMNVWECPKGHSFKVDVPLVWHKNYILAQQALYYALGEALGSQGINGLNATFISSCGTKLRFTPKAYGPGQKTKEYLDQLEEQGYSDFAILDAWVEIAKAAAAAWPTATFYIPLEPNEEESFPAFDARDVQQKILTHCLASYPDRTMILWEGKDMHQAALWAELRGAGLAHVSHDGFVHENHSAIFVGEVV